MCLTIGGYVPRQTYVLEVKWSNVEGQSTPTIGRNPDVMWRSHIVSAIWVIYYVSSRRPMDIDLYVFLSTVILLFQASRDVQILVSSIYSYNPEHDVNVSSFSFAY